MRDFQGSARKIDLVLWLDGALQHNVPLLISWDAIAEQFGAGFQTSARVPRRLPRKSGT